MKKVNVFLVLFVCVACAANYNDEYSIRKIDDNDSYRYSEGAREYKNDIPMPKGSYTGIYKVGKPYTILGQNFYPREDNNYVREGEASWYGDDFHRKKTSNGETFNMNDLTAAHTTLPMPSVVQITNLENGRSINVRINDRGPFIKGRIIDVSKRVARELGFHEKGTTRVRVKYLRQESDELLRKLGLHR